MQSKSAFHLLSVLVLCCACAASATNTSLGMASCILPASGGQPYIDLNPLVNSNGGQDWKPPSVAYPGFNFLVKVCGSLSYTNSFCPSGSGVCEYFNTAATHQYVNINSWTISRISNGAMLSGTGAACGTGGNYKAMIEFICDSTTTPTLVNTLDDYASCTAKFQMKTSVACGGASPSGDGSGSGATDVGMIMCLVFFIPFIAYFLVGAGLLHHQGKRGTEMVPNYGFWSALPGLIKDGSIYSWGVVTGKEKLGYSRV